MPRKASQRKPRVGVSKPEFGTLHITMRTVDVERLQKVATRRLRKINIQGRAFILRALDRVEAKEAKRATPAGA